MDSLLHNGWLNVFIDEHIRTCITSIDYSVPAYVQSEGASLVIIALFMWTHDV